MCLDYYMRRRVGEREKNINDINDDFDDEPHFPLLRPVSAKKNGKQQQIRWHRRERAPNNQAKARFFRMKKM